jgi:hypothetical protein
MRKTITLGALVTLLLFLCTTFAYAEAQVGVKAGDWIKCEYVSSGSPPSGAPQWVKVECLSVIGTTATVCVTFKPPMEQNKLGLCRGTLPRHWKSHFPSAYTGKLENRRHGQSD